MSGETKFKKGQKSGPGRPPGSQNKVTKEVKQMVIDALSEAGGVEYLLACAKNPKTTSAFLTLVGKVLPLQVQGDPDNPVGIQVIERVIVKK